MSKINFIHPSLLSWDTNYILKNSAIHLADSILANNSRTRILPDMRLVMKYQLTILVFILDHFPEKLITKFFKYSKKIYFGGNFGLVSLKFEEKNTWEKGLCQWQKSTIVTKISIVAKIRKKLMSHCWEKCWTDG